MVAVCWWLVVKLKRDGKADEEAKLFNGRMDQKENNGASRSYLM